MFSTTTSSRGVSMTQTLSAFFEGDSRNAALAAAWRWVPLELHSFHSPEHQSLVHAHNLTLRNSSFHTACVMMTFIFFTHIQVTFESHLLCWGSLTTAHQKFVMHMSSRSWLVWSLQQQQQQQQHYLGVFLEMQNISHTSELQITLYFNRILG